MTVRRWIAWKLAQLFYHADPSAHRVEEIEVVSRLDGTVSHHILIVTDAFDAGVGSGSRAKGAETLPYYVRYRADDGEWEEL